MDEKTIEKIMGIKKKPSTQNVSNQEEPDKASKMTICSQSSTEPNIALPEPSESTNRIERLDQNSYLTKGEISQLPQNTEKSGPITLKNGAVYTGGWHGKMRNGSGTQDWPDGSRYVGEWLDDKAHGYGILYHASGDKYEGTWQSNKAYGKGLYTNINGSRYSGDWLEDT